VLDFAGEGIVPCVQAMQPRDQLVGQVTGIGAGIGSQEQRIDFGNRPAAITLAPVCAMNSTSAAWCSNPSFSACEGV
jgi:hypothetical protein